MNILNKRLSNILRASQSDVKHFQKNCVQFTGEGLEGWPLIYSTNLNLPRSRLVHQGKAPAAESLALYPANRITPGSRRRGLEAPQRRADPPRRAGVIRPGGTRLVVTTDSPRKRGSKATKGAGPLARGC